MGREIVKPWRLGYRNFLCNCECGIPLCAAEMVIELQPLLSAKLIITVPYENQAAYNLGVDASTGYHTYGFDWQPNKITWYVDGKVVHTATSNIPKTPGKIMMNAWPGIGVNEWLKAYDGKTPLTAKYE